MTTPKRRILSFVFTVLCFTKSLLIVIFIIIIIIIIIIVINIIEPLVQQIVARTHELSGDDVIRTLHQRNRRQMDASPRDKPEEVKRYSR